MKLTPIKIPGKRKRDNTKAAITARKAAPQPRGRPLKLPVPENVSISSESVESSPKRPKGRSLKNIKSKRKMSNLEKLPVELLDKVFLFCMELSLPRASPVIAGKLSSMTVYMQTLMSAFGPTWEKWHGCERVAINRWTENFGNPELQSAILRCRWASLSMILKAKEQWVQKFAPDRPLVSHYFLRYMNPNLINEEEITAQDGSNKPPYFFKALPAARGSDDSSSSITTTDYFALDFDGFCQFVDLEDGDGSLVWDHISWTSNPDLARGVEIPQSLLSGPWDEDAARFLFWMVKSGASIDWLNSTSGEVALVGLRLAIFAGDTKVIHLLQWAGLIEKLDVDTLLFAFRNAGGDRLQVVNQLLMLGFQNMDGKQHGRVQRELEEMRDEAVMENDHDKLAFIGGIVNSSTLAGSMEIRL